MTLEDMEKIQVLLWVAAIAAPLLVFGFFLGAFLNNSGALA